MSRVAATITSDAIVLHVFDYLDSSRIYRLATREAGVQSVLARGARNSRKRFGSALGLFSEGRAEIGVREGRDLQTLNSFDVTQSRIALAQESRFLGASLIAELALRFSSTEAGDELFDALGGAFDALMHSHPALAAQETLAGAWAVVSALGFEPALRECAACHEAIAANLDVRFNHRAGGAICANCERLWPSERRLPAAARNLLDHWLQRGQTEPLSAAPMAKAEVRSHARLLREFVQEHMGDERPLRAFEIWERERHRG